MDIKTMMEITDLAYRTRRIIEHSLHEIDRRALNAMVLVKRGGKKLAGYGVVAQAFREQAARLKKAASPLQQSIAPLLRAQMRIVQYRRHEEMFLRAAQMLGPEKTFALPDGDGWQKTIFAEETEALSILRALVQTVVRLQEGISEQEYVVTIGRIEAALSEGNGAPLMRVSTEMGVAVATVRDAIWRYRNHLEEVLHESSIGI